MRSNGSFEIKRQGPTVDVQHSSSMVSVVSDAGSLRLILKNTLQQGSVVLYVKCPILGAHYCIGRMSRLREPFHLMPLTIVYKQSLGRAKGFRVLAESSLIPTGFYLKVRDLVKRYIGFTSGIRAFQPRIASCSCGSARIAVLERVRLRSGKIRYHLSFKCPKCGKIERPWTQHYLDRFAWLIRRAQSLKVVKVGGLRCRRCGEKAVKAVTQQDSISAMFQPDYTRYTLQCRRCGFTINPPRFEDLGKELAER